MLPLCVIAKVPTFPIHKISITLLIFPKCLIPIPENHCKVNKTYWIDNGLSSSILGRLDILGHYIVSWVPDCWLSMWS